jgi:pyruvate/2-oxoglutarate dehydrogenase complex dihydrolipoamide dehydrogenase (E3) component
VEKFDALIIGAGQAGGPLATTFAGAGKKTALVESDAVGGTCVNWGCTPTKTLIASAEVAYLSRRAQDYGVKVPGVSVDFTAVIQRKTDVVKSFRAGSERSIQKSGVTLFRGEASFSGPKTLDIQLNDGGSLQATADTIILNTGAHSQVPQISGLEKVPFFDSSTIMELAELPEHLLILGGGYVALEFGQLFLRLGSQVTILQRGPQLLTREDRDIADALRDILRDEGMTIHLNAEAQQVEQTPDGNIHVKVKTPDGEKTVTGSHLLSAVGRAPNSEALNLKEAGIETDDHGFICTNARLETSAAGIYAVGDVKGGPAFTHISYDDFRILRTNLIEGGSASIEGRLTPYVVFTDPQLGRIGMSENEARSAGIAYQVAQLPMTGVARAIETDRTQGVMKALVDKNTRQILGAAILGFNGGELMSMIEIAMMGKLPYTALKDGVFAHPTLAESLNNLFSALK